MINIRIWICISLHILTLNLYYLKLFCHNFTKILLSFLNCQKMIIINNENAFVGVLFQLIYYRIFKMRERSYYEYNYICIYC